MRLAIPETMTNALGRQRAYLTMEIIAECSDQFFLDEAQLIRQVIGLRRQAMDWQLSVLKRWTNAARSQVVVVEPQRNDVARSTNSAKLTAVRAQDRRAASPNSRATNRNQPGISLAGERGKCGSAA